MTNKKEMEKLRQLRLEDMYNRLDEVTAGFQWGQASGTLGEVYLDRDANMLRLDVYVYDTDEEAPDEQKGLVVSMEVDPWMEPHEQVRRLIHFHICHEADEQMWFTYKNDSLPGGIYVDRPFYPHNADGSLRDV